MSLEPINVHVCCSANELSDSADHMKSLQKAYLLNAMAAEKDKKAPR